MRPSSQHSTAPKQSTAPAPRQYKPVTPAQRLSRHPHYPEPAEPVKQSISSRLWPFKSPKQEEFDHSKKEPARGVEAAKRVVKEGVLDSRYKKAAGNWTRLMVFTPIALYLSYELFERRFGGREQKRFPVHGNDEPTGQTNMTDR